MAFRVEERAELRPRLADVDREARALGGEEDRVRQDGVCGEAVLEHHQVGVVRLARALEQLAVLVLDQGEIGRRDGARHLAWLGPPHVRVRVDFRHLGVALCLGDARAHLGQHLARGRARSALGVDEAAVVGLEVALDLLDAPEADLGGFVAVQQRLA